MLKMSKKTHLRTITSAFEKTDLTDNKLEVEWTFFIYLLSPLFTGVKLILYSECLAFRN